MSLLLRKKWFKERLVPSRYSQYSMTEKQLRLSVLGKPKVECYTCLISIEHVQQSQTVDCGAFVKLKALQCHGVWTGKERNVELTAYNSLLTNYWLYDLGPII